MQIQLAQILFQIANFLIVFFILKKFLYQPILKILEERSQRIKAGLEAAETSIQEKAKLEQTKKKVMVEAEKQGAELIEQARTRAKKLEQEIVAKAKKTAETLIGKEHQLLETKMAGERRKLQVQIAQLVVEATRTVLKKSLTQKEQSTIINRQIAQIKKLKLT